MVATSWLVRKVDVVATHWEDRESVARTKHVQVPGRTNHTRTGRKLEASLAVQRQRNRQTVRRKTEKYRHRSEKKVREEVEEMHRPRSSRRRWFWRDLLVQVKEPPQRKQHPLVKHVAGVWEVASSSSPTRILIRNEDAASMIRLRIHPDLPAKRKQVILANVALSAPPSPRSNWTR